MINDKWLVLMSSIVPLTLSLQQAADFVGVGRDKMRELIRTKRIKAFILDRRIKVSRAACEAYVKSLSEYRADALAPDFAAPRPAIKGAPGSGSFGRAPDKPPLAP